MRNRLRNQPASPQTPSCPLLRPQKAYDLVPRGLLKNLAEERVPTGLSTIIRALLSPLRLKPKFEKTDVEVLTVSAVPQGGPRSPDLFNIFMNTYIPLLNTTPSTSMTSCFADDALVLSKKISKAYKGNSKGPKPGPMICPFNAAHRNLLASNYTRQ